MFQTTIACTCAHVHVYTCAREIYFWAWVVKQLTSTEVKMVSKTLVALKAILDLDPTISEEHREGILQFAMVDTFTVANIFRDQTGEEVVSIERAATILGKSKPTIQRYLKNGLLTPIIPPGMTRSAGISMKSIRDFGRVGEPNTGATQGQG